MHNKYNINNLINIMYKQVNRKRISNEQISSEFVKRQQLDTLFCLPRVRRSTHKICNKCLVSSEYYEDIFCTNCGKKY